MRPLNRSVSAWGSFPRTPKIKLLLPSLHEEFPFEPTTAPPTSFSLEFQVLRIILGLLPRVACAGAFPLNGLRLGFWGPLQPERFCQGLPGTRLPSARPLPGPAPSDRAVAMRLGRYLGPAGLWSSFPAVTQAECLRAGGFQPSCAAVGTTTEF